MYLVGKTPQLMSLNYYILKKEKKNKISRGGFRGGDLVTCGHDFTEPIFGNRVVVPNFGI